MPNTDDIRFIIRECGSRVAALRYCERVASHHGPLAGWYSEAARMIRELA